MPRQAIAASGPPASAAMSSSSRRRRCGSTRHLDATRTGAVGPFGRGGVGGCLHRPCGPVPVAEELPMNLKRIITIFGKDLQAGIRNAQILIALLVPLGLGLAYNAMLPDTTKLPAVSLVYSAPDTSRLPSALRT